MNLQIIQKVVFDITLIVLLFRLETEPLLVVSLNHNLRPVLADLPDTILSSQILPHALQKPFPTPS